MSNYHINDSYAFEAYAKLYFLNDSSNEFFINDYILLNKSMIKINDKPSRSGELAVMYKLLEHIEKHLLAVIDKWNNSTHEEYAKEETIPDNTDVLHIPLSNETVEA